MTTTIIPPARIRVYDLKTRKGYNHPKLLFDDQKAVEAILKKLKFVSPDDLQWATNGNELIIIDPYGNWMYPPKHLELDFYLESSAFQ